VRRPLLLLPGSDAAIDTLWEVSERETGIAMDVVAALAEAERDG